jgi:tetratricopeptide (TPR) repeat protein
LSDFQTILQNLQQRTDKTLDTLERENRWEEALEIYHAAGAEVDALDIPRDDPAYRLAYREARRVRAYLYLREANALRALGRPGEATALGEKELEAATASGDGITIARSMFSLGGTYLANGDVERGLKFLDDSKPMFEHGDDYDHRQGLGWWYIIQADIRNAGLLPDAPEAAVAMADEALEILRPLKNWPGVARAHEARAKAYERMGDAEAARLARTAQKMAEEVLRLESGDTAYNQA